VKPWPNQADLGRSAIVGNDAFKMFFKVPSLRNIEKTGPYFHDSSAKTLEAAVTKMAAHQLGRKLSGEQLADIVSFLKSLTGKIPTEYIKKRPF
jgi:cytochrome c peroxidase